MFVPMSILIPMALLALIPIVIVLLMIHNELRRAGLCFIGRCDQYLENHLLLQRWCLFYIPLRRREACHSYSTLFE